MHRSQHPMSAIRGTDLDGQDCPRRLTTPKGDLSDRTSMDSNHDLGSGNPWTTTTSSQPATCNTESLACSQRESSDCDHDDDCLTGDIAATENPDEAPATDWETVFIKEEPPSPCDLSCDVLHDQPEVEEFYIKKEQESCFGDQAMETAQRPQPSYSYPVIGVERMTSMSCEEETSENNSSCDTAGMVKEYSNISSNELKIEDSIQVQASFAETVQVVVKRGSPRSYDGSHESHDQTEEFILKHKEESSFGDQDIETAQRPQPSSYPVIGWERMISMSCEEGTSENYSSCDTAGMMKKCKDISRKISSKDSTVMLGSAGNSEKSKMELFQDERESCQSFQSKKIDIEGKSSKCTVCDKQSTQSGNLKVHMDISSGEKPFQCTVCHKQTTQCGNLKVHMDISSEEKPFQCTVCHKQFAKSRNMKRHMIVHTGEKPYQCKSCHKQFAHSSAVKAHMRIHTGEKPYQCEICHKQFTQSSSMTAHMRIHTGEKPYQCEICYKQFTQSSSMTTHMKIHTGEKPYQCEVCHKRSAHSSDMKKHMRIHTGEKPYQCEICHKQFGDSSTAIAHRRIHTGEKPIPM